MSEGKGIYTRSPERGFRKFAMAFWKQPRTGLIYGNSQVNVYKARQFRKDVLEKFGVKPSYGQLMGRAVANALTQVPEGNAKIIWGQAYLKDTVDVYFQVDIEGGKDLSGVVINDCGRKTIVQVCEELRDLATKLRKGQDEQYEKTQKGCIGAMPGWAMRHLLGFLTFLEYNLGITPTWLGARPEPFGTVMVTNVSMFGIDVAYAPLVPVSRVPMVILVGRVVDMPWAVKGEIKIRPAISLSATFDHRLLDGYKIGKFSRLVRGYMENPYKFEGEALGLADPFAEEEPGEPASAAPASAEPPAADEEGQADAAAPTDDAETPA